MIKARDHPLHLVRVPNPQIPNYLFLVESAPLKQVFHVIGHIIYDLLLLQVNRNSDSFHLGLLPSEEQLVAVCFMKLGHSQKLRWLSMFYNLQYVLQSD